VSPDHLDTVGPIAKDVSRLVKGMALLQEGFEDLYDEAKLARPDAKTIRIGRLNVPKTDPVIDIAIDALLIQKGFQIVQLDEDFTEAWGQAQRDGNIVAASGAWSTNEHLHRRLRVSARAKEALLVGEVAHGKALKKALARKAAWQAELGRVFESVDAIALPVLRTTPPEIHRVELHAEVEAHMLLIQNTAAVNFAGNPALAIPVPLAGSDFPMTSIQFVGPHGSEASLLNIGRLAESLK
jgi:amidase